MSATAFRESGFTLIEVLVASALVVCVIGGLAQLTAKGVGQSHAARNAGAALALAQGKLEELRAAAWSYDASGMALSDAALIESPADSISTDRDGWWDAADAFGQPLPTTDAGRTVFRRRWSVTSVAPADADTLALKVCVRSVVSPTGSGGPDACVSTLMTRKP